MFFIARTGAAAQWRRRETLQARQHPISPTAGRRGRVYNQKATTLRNGTTEEGWFYPTPAALKAAADVRGTLARSCWNPPDFDPRFDVPARRQRRPHYPHFQFDSNYTYGMVHRE